MTDLLHTLVDDSLAELMSGVSLERFQVFKEKRKVHIELLAERALPYALVDQFTEAVRNRFQLTDVDLELHYDGQVLTAESAGLIYENLLLDVIRTLPAARGVLLNSHATLENGQFIVHLKFGGEKTLEDNGVVKLLEKRLKEVYHAEVAVVFCNDSSSADEVFQKLETQRAELARDAAAKAVMAAKQTPAAPQKREVPKTAENVLLGKAFGGELTPMGDIDENSGKVMIEGRVIAHEVRELRNKKTLLELYVADTESCMICKAFLNEQQFEPLKGSLKKLGAVRISGTAQYDTYAKEVVIIMRDMMKAELSVRPDLAEEKRVELHAHTTMSAEDALTKPEALIARAAAWGHKAVAITDHGVVQAYPEAFEAGEKHGIKIIYGMEAYFVNDTQSALFGNYNGV